MTYGLEIFSGTNPDEEVIFSTQQGDTFLKKQYTTTFSDESAAGTIVFNSIPTHLNRTNSVICVSLDSTVATKPPEIKGNLRAIFTGGGDHGAGQITIPQCAESGVISGSISVLQFADMTLSTDAFGLLVTNDLNDDLVIDHDSLVWGVQGGGTLQDQNWFGYENNGGEYCEYRLVELDIGEYPADQPFGLAVKRADISHWVVQPDFFVDRDTASITQLRFHRVEGENSDLHYLIITPADETYPPIMQAGDYGLEIYGPTGQLGWSSRWEQGVVKTIHEMNQGFEHTEASPINNYDLEAGYDGVDKPVAAGTAGYSESAQNLRSRGRSAIENLTGLDIQWPFDYTVKPTNVYTLFSTGTGYIQYYKGMRTKDGVNQGLEGGGLHAWSTKLNSTDYVIDMARLADGPTPASPAQYCTRAFPSYHPTGNVIFLGSTYVGPVIRPGELCTTGRTLGTSVEDYYYSPDGLIPYSYPDLTFVFCLLPREFKTANIFQAEGNEFYLGLSGTSGNLIIGGKTTDGTTWSYTTTTDPLTINEWNSIYISITKATTSTSATIHIWVDGVAEVDSTFTAAAYDFAAHDNTGITEIGKFDLDCDIAFVWVNDEFLHPTTYWQEFFNLAAKPKNIGIYGDGPTSVQPLNYFPDGSFIAQDGTLVDTFGDGSWNVSTDGWIPESETNPSGCPKRLDGGDYGPPCLTGRAFDNSSSNYYDSADGFIPSAHEDMTLIFCIRPLSNPAVDALWYDTTADGGGKKPFFLGQKANGDLWIGGTLTGGSQWSWSGSMGWSLGTWSSVYITANLRPIFNDMHLEIWMDSSQIVNTTISVGASETQAVAHGANGIVELAKGLDMDISFIWCDDAYWYQGEYWDEFFFDDNIPKNLGPTGDVATGFDPLNYYPDGSVIKNVVQEPSTNSWTVHGFVPESDTNPTYCAKKNDGGDGVGVCVYARELTDTWIHYYYNDDGFITTSAEEQAHLALVFCFYPKSSGSTNNVWVFGDNSLEYTMELDTDTLKFQVPVYDNDSSERQYMTFWSDPDVVLDQWNSVIFSISTEDGTSVKADIMVNGNYDSYYISNPFSLTVPTPTNGFADSDGGEFRIGTELSSPTNNYTNMEYDFSYFFLHTYDATTWVQADDLWDYFFDTAGVPQPIDIGGDASVPIGEQPMFYFKDGSPLDNDGFELGQFWVSDDGIISEASTNPTSCTVAGLDDDVGPTGHHIVWETSSFTTLDVVSGGYGVVDIFFNDHAGASGHAECAYNIDEDTFGFKIVIHSDYVPIPAIDPYIVKIVPVSGDTSLMFTDGAMGFIDPAAFNVWLPLGDLQVGLEGTSAGTYNAVCDVSVARAYDPTVSYPNYVPISSTIVTRTITWDLTVTA